MIVTIDGSAGSGKSTVARKFAARLDVPYLDTGAMYRAVAYAALEKGADFSDEQALLEVARSVKLELDCGPTSTRVRVDGRDVSEAIRTMAVSAVISHVAKCPAIREILIEQQRRIGKRLGSFVSEGRDQGNAVFPDAEHKFVLDASLETRAKRRLQELIADGEDVSIKVVMHNLRLRDRTDSKQWQPLLEPGRVTVIDTTEMTVQEVIDRIAKLVSARSSP